MKLLRLELSRYGHLTDVVLDFPETAALHVVLAPNEAGKSTALAALADALFGFGHRTDFDFLHGGANLRVGFVLRAADGGQRVFRRRKGRKDTLRDAADCVVAEDALHPFLGNVSRGTFEQAFGLNGKRLREGAEALMETQGEAGESILAGMGLMHLRAVADKLDEEARVLVGDGRGVRRLSAAADAWKRATQTAQAASVRPAAWTDATETHERLTAELAAVQMKVRELGAEQSRLERVRRVRPLLGQLDAARDAHAEVADAPLLPADAEERLKRWSDQQRDARRDREREAAEIRVLTAQRDGLAADPTVLDVEELIDGLIARRSVVREAEGDLPTVREQVAAHTAIIREAGQELGSQDPPERLRELVPTEAARRAAQRAITAREKAFARIGPATDARDRAQRDRDRTADALAKAPETPATAHLRKAVDDTRAEGRLETELDGADREVSDAARAALAALTALPLWTRDAVALAAAPVPLEADARTTGDALAAAGKRLDDAERTAANVAADRSTLEQEIAEIVRGGPVPTREAVAAARAERDSAWNTIRTRVEGVDTATPDERRSLADRFETLRDAADRLADQRADDAHSVADYELKRARLAELGQEQQSADTEVVAARENADRAAGAWRTLWAPCGMVPSSPDAMAEWRRQRAEVLRLFDRETKASQHRERIVARRDDALALLRSLFPSLPEDGSLAATLAGADAVCVQAEAAVAARDKLLTQLEAEERRLQDAAAALHRAETDLQATTPAWTQALPTLGLPADTGVETVQAALAVWARIAEETKPWRIDERRVQDMEAAIRGFGDDVRGATARLGENPDGDPHMLLDVAARRLTAARTARDDAVRLTDQIKDRRKASEQAQILLHEADRELEELRVLANVADDLALERAVARARRRVELEAEIGKLESALLVAGDQHPEPVLREAVAAIDPDAVPARLDEIGREQTELGHRRETLAEALAAASRDLSEMAAGRDAAAHAQDAEAALAEARNAAERYARLHVARTLLQAGINRVRREQQGPLLTAAGQNFSTLTSGRYVRLAIDQDSAGRALIQAVRPDGEECPVWALSDGARDQLYLALRVAAVQAQVATSEPLPFVGDDLLVHFDDDRASAALELLSRLGSQTQVLLFTHHRHVADLAVRCAGVAVQTWP